MLAEYIGLHNPGPEARTVDPSFDFRRLPPEQWTALQLTALETEEYSVGWPLRSES